MLKIDDVTIAPGLEYMLLLSDDPFTDAKGVQHPTRFCHHKKYVAIWKDAPNRWRQIGLAIETARASYRALPALDRMQKELRRRFRRSCRRTKRESGTSTTKVARLAGNVRVTKAPVVTALAAAV